MGNRLWIGIDIGTTNLKGVLYDKKEQVLAEVAKGYPTFYTEAGYAEQDIADILNAFKETLRILVLRAHELGMDIEGLAFSSAMHSLILLDQDKQPLTRNIIWADNRARTIIDAFKQTEDWLGFYRKSGTPIHPMSPFAKLLWFKAQGLLHDDTYACGIKEYLIYRLSGEFLMDYSIASATGLLNIRQMMWDPEILDYIGITAERMPQLVDVDHEVSMSDPDFLKETGINPDVRLVLGASDGCLVNLGAGALNKGQTTLTIGTSGAVRMTLERPVLDPQGRTFCYYLRKNTWVIGGAVNNGGNVLGWLSELLYENASELFEKLPEILKKVPAGSEGLRFIPHLHGERAPYWNANLSASFVSLKPIHRKDHLVRAALEGILLNVCNVWRILQEISGASDEITVTGGLLANEDILPMVADIFGQDLIFQKGIEHTCLGVIRIAHPGPEAMGSPVGGFIFKPDNERSQVYREIHRDFDEVSAKLR